MDDINTSGNDDAKRTLMHDTGIYPVRKGFSMILERFAEKIAVGKPAFGTSLRFADPAIIEAIGTEWDFVWVDLQHGMIDVKDVAGLVRACDLSGVSALIRLAGTVAPDVVSYVLDLDVAGVVIAQVDTVEQAHAVVNAAKFPPLGNRSWGGRRVIDRNGRAYAEMANNGQLLIVQIESPQGVANAEALAAMPGVDGLMLGPDDLCLRLGIPIGSPLYDGPLGEATRIITAACHQHGKLAMGFGGATVEAIDQAVNIGFNLISLGADATFLKQGSAAFAQAARKWEEQ